MRLEPILFKIVVMLLALLFKSYARQQLELSTEVFILPPLEMKVPVVPFGYVVHQNLSF